MKPKTEEKLKVPEKSKEPEKLSDEKTKEAEKSKEPKKNTIQKSPASPPPETSPKGTTQPVEKDSRPSSIPFDFRRKDPLPTSVAPGPAARFPVNPNNPMFSQRGPGPAGPSGPFGAPGFSSTPFNPSLFGPPPGGPGSMPPTGFTSGPPGIFGSGPGPVPGFCANGPGPGGRVGPPPPLPQVSQPNPSVPPPNVSSNEIHVWSDEELAMRALRVKEAWKNKKAHEEQGGERSGLSLSSILESH